jgi:hypothetical protein
MDIISAYREVGSYHGAAKMCSTTPKTVKRVVEAAQRSEPRPPPEHNYDEVVDLVAQRVEKTKGRISAKRLLPAAMAAGYTGSDRNFRRLVADEKRNWRTDNHRGRRPDVWEPGDVNPEIPEGLHIKQVAAARRVKNLGSSATNFQQLFSKPALP